MGTAVDRTNGRRSARRTPAGATALAAVILASLALPASAAKDDLDLVSRTTAGAAANGGSFGAAISGDGQRVAFVSTAANLGAVANTPTIFVRDLASGTTTLVSRAAGPAGAVADGASSQPAISGDGHFVAFRSEANNLSAEDNNAVTNVFVRDLQTDALTLVSRAAGRPAPARTATRSSRRSRPTGGSWPSPPRPTTSRRTTTTRSRTSSSATCRPAR